MPRFKLEQLPSPERRAARLEPAGLEEFAAEAAVTPPPELVERKQGRALPSSPMPVRFTPEAKLALEKLAAHEQRSKQQIITRVLEPVLIAAARDL